MNTENNEAARQATERYPEGENMYLAKRSAFIEGFEAAKQEEPTPQKQLTDK